MSSADTNGESNNHGRRSPFRPINVSVALQRLPAAAAPSSRRPLPFPEDQEQRQPLQLAPPPPPENDDDDVSTDLSDPTFSGSFPSTPSPPSLLFDESQRMTPLMMIPPTPSPPLSARGGVTAQMARNFVLGTPPPNRLERAVSEALRHIDAFGHAVDVADTARAVAREESNTARHDVAIAASDAASSLAVDSARVAHASLQNYMRLSAQLNPRPVDAAAVQQPAAPPSAPTRPVVEPMDQENVVGGAGGSGALPPASGRGGSPSLLSLVCEENMDAGPTPTPEALGILYNRIVRLLECPVCMDNMRPGTAVVGSCANGHIVCTRCTLQVKLGEEEEDEAANIQLNQNPKCPVCRSRTFSTNTRNYMAISLIDALTDTTLYKCQHSGCIVTLLGNKILDHEKTCEFKPFRCPRAGCRDKINLIEMMQQKHACINLVDAVDEDIPSIWIAWKTTIPFDHFFSFDSCREKVSLAFCPRVLLPFDTLAKGVRPVNQLEIRQKNIALMVTSNQPMYVNIIEMQGQGGLMLYMSSLKDKADVPDSVLQSYFIMHAYVHPPTGKIGPSALVRPVAQGSKLVAYDQGLYLSRGDINHYISLMSLYGGMCASCSLTHLHIHFEVKERIYKTPITTYM